MYDDEQSTFWFVADDTEANDFNYRDLEEITKPENQMTFSSKRAFSPV
jgi:hypothetical protein